MYISLNAKKTLNSGSKWRVRRVTCPAGRAKKKNCQCKGLNNNLICLKFTFKIYIMDTITLWAGSSNIPMRDAKLRV